MSARWLVVAWIGLGGCQGCRELDLPDTPDPIDPPDSTDPTDEAVDDTAPEPPCAVPEAEPNDGPDEANALPLEWRGCGTFDAITDGDFWSFTLEEDAWLGLQVDAFELGSRADITVSLVSDDLDLGVSAGQFEDSPDVYLRFPSPPGAYTALVRQAADGGGIGGGGDRYFYEILASSAKPALASWDLDEVEGNDTQATAQLVYDAVADPRSEGVTLLGGLDGPDDEDWFRVEVPAGRHRLVARVQAHALGSAGDFAIRRHDAAGVKVQEARRSLTGFSLDPWLEVTTVSPGSVWLRVLEEDLEHGRPYWYALTVTVEAE